LPAVIREPPVSLDATLPMAGRPAVRRFWQAARGFWQGASAWTLLALLVAGVVLQVAVQYRLNFWNRDFFNALEARDGGQIWRQAQILVALAAASVSLAVVAVWGRMTFQRLWRDWLTGRLISHGSPSSAISVPASSKASAKTRSTASPRMPAWRTDAPIDLVVGLLNSVLSASAFVVVLWNVGGVLELSLWGRRSPSPATWSAPACSMRR
jgi:putative ATP-binding cassette transporter